MERLTAITALSHALVALSKAGDTVQVRHEDGHFIMLNQLDDVDPIAIVDAFRPYLNDLTVGETRPSTWLINDDQPIGELLYNYPELKLTLSYAVDGQKIEITTDSAARLNMESETIRLKASQFEDSYLELVFSDKASLVHDLLKEHGLKIKNMAVDRDYITTIALEPRS